MTKKLFRVGVDIDGVLADLATAMTTMMEQETGVKVAKADVNKWDFYVEQLGSVSKMLALMDEAWRLGIVPVEEESIAAEMKRLARNSESVSIITARTYDSHPLVVNWLHNHCIRYSNLVFTHLQTDKFDFGIDVLIDDNPKLVGEMAEHPDKLLLLRRQPWNAAVVDLSTNVRPVGSLTEAVDLIRAISRE